MTTVVTRRQQLNSLGEFMRRLSALVAVSCAALSFAPPAAAQSFPTAPVKMVVTTGAGGSPDVIARIVAEGLSKQWNQQVFVTNHPGAAGSIGMRVAGTSPSAAPSATDQPSASGSPPPQPPPPSLAPNHVQPSPPNPAPFYTQPPRNRPPTTHHSSLSTLRSWCTIPPT